MPHHGGNSAVWTSTISLIVVPTTTVLNFQHNKPHTTSNHETRKQTNLYWPGLARLLKVWTTRWGWRSIWCCWWRCLYPPHSVACWPMIIMVGSWYGVPGSSWREATNKVNHQAASKCCLVYHQCNTREECTCEEEELEHCPLLWKNVLQYDQKELLQRFSTMLKKKQMIVTPLTLKNLLQLISTVTVQSCWVLPQHKAFYWVVLEFVLGSLPKDQWKAKQTVRHICDMFQPKNKNRRSFNNNVISVLTKVIYCQENNIQYDGEGSYASVRK